ncbi:MAG: alpha/beta fold hydrolase [Thermoplasmatota archaeon]
MNRRALPADIAAMMPFARTTVRVGDVELSVVDDGRRDARETLLFVHGNPTWSFLWRRLLGPARDAGHRVVAPDHAGFGLSSKPTDGAYYSAERHVQNLEAVAAALDLRDVTLVLHDWGGPIGMGFAARHPDRVKRIVIANTVAFAPKEKRPLSRWHARFAKPFWFDAAIRFNLIERTAMIGGVTRKLPRAVARAYRWPMKERGGRVAAARFVQLVPDGPEHPSCAVLREVEAAAPKLAHAPVLVLWADRDRVMKPKFAERWLTSGLDVRAVRHISPNGGHFWQEDDPEPFLREILAFVST